jgi:hypothetical protein
MPRIRRRRKAVDFAYLVLVAVFWLLMAGMAIGCAKLGGPKP